MRKKDEIIQLEGVDPVWMTTPEGQKRTQEIFARNADKLQLRFGPGDLPPGYVKLRVVHSDGTQDTLQQCNETSSLPQR